MPPPMLGEHTIDALGEYGFSDEQIDAWLTSQVVLQHEHALG
ncbi:hypothetical protein [Burkholderia sp. S171]|nr:hypothetical protein [Burkholderia sp. S171]